VFEIAQDSLYTYPVGLFRLMHEFANMMNGKSNIRLSELEIMKATNNTSVQGRIIKCFGISCCQCHSGGHWNRTRLSTIHFGFLRRSAMYLR